MMLFAGFENHRVEGEGATIHLRRGGDGPPLLLLHGYPQTGAMWHAMAADLARDYTLIIPDLRGYGDSDRPATDPAHRTYSKRAVAADMVTVMRRLGYDRFMAAGHDRGGRVLHRMCLDHPQAVTHAAVLDIVPTATVFEATNQTLATGYFHWFFLIQPGGLPERMIGHEPSLFLRSCLAGWSRGRLDFFDERALAEYERCFADPQVIHATCEDYRAGATIDLVDDREDGLSRITCPLLVLWGRHGLMHRHFDVLQCWRDKASGTVSGSPVDAGHFLCEEAPETAVDRFRAFFPSA
ncbi:MAG: alpha/beta hydrolase [Geminicoccaceae bacterium]|nr:alpha/beta hydrolase [Geminicoccaceae bacterium]